MRTAIWSTVAFVFGMIAATALIYTDESYEPPVKNERVVKMHRWA